MTGITLAHRLRTSPGWCDEQRPERAGRGQRAPAGPAQESSPRDAQPGRHALSLLCQLREHGLSPQNRDKNGPGNHDRTATAAPDPVAEWWDHSAQITPPGAAPGVTYEVLDLALSDLAGHPHHRY